MEIHNIDPKSEEGIELVKQHFLNKIKEIK
jgi:hypothetical protein